MAAERRIATGNRVIDALAAWMRRRNVRTAARYTAAKRRYYRRRMKKDEYCDLFVGYAKSA